MTIHFLYSRQGEIFQAQVDNIFLRWLAHGFYLKFDFYALELISLFIMIFTHLFICKLLVYMIYFLKVNGTGCLIDSHKHTHFKEIWLQLENIKVL